MKQEEKQLLLKDLCARLPNGVRISKTIDDFVSEPKLIKSLYPDGIILVEEEFPNVYAWDISKIKPYLRPMSSMTEKEKERYCELQDKFLCSSQYPVTDAYELFDWLNEHHFDYRGLIEKGLAIEVTKENNPYKD